MTSEAGNNRSPLLHAIENLFIHDHLCLIYETRAEQFGAVIPFMRIGLERGDQCVYIADDNSAAAVKDAMHAGGIDVDAAIKSGALAVITKKDAYLKKGYFDPDLMIEFLREAVDAAKRSGYETLRATGEMTWALGPEIGTERLIEYESKLNNFFPRHDILAICQYNRKLFRPEIIRDVIRTHPLVIYGEQVCKNFYYMPPEEFFKTEHPSQEVDRLLRNIKDREKSERELAESEARYRSLIDSSMDAILLTTPDGAILEANSAACSMFGSTEEELRRIGREGVIDVSDPRLAQAIEERRRTGRFKGEFVLIRKDGTKFTGEISSTIFKDRNNRDRTSMMIRDVTERKAIETLMRDSERKWRNIFDSVSDGILLADRESRKFYLGNATICRLLGYTSDEIKTLEVMDLHPEKDLAAVVETFDQLGRKEIDMAVNIPVKRSDGTVFYADIRSSLIVAEGKECLLGIFRDVSDRKRVEEKLKQASSYNRSLIEASLDPLVTIDASGKIRDVNAATESVTGRNRDKLIGTDFSDYFTDPEKARAGYQQVFQDGMVHDYPLEIRHRDGTVTPVLYNASVFKNQTGEVVGVFAAARDITELKRAEEKLQKSEEFIRTILETVDEAFIVVDRDYRVLSANRAYLEQVKLPMAGVIGKHCYTLSHHFIKQCSEAGENCAVKRSFETGLPDSTMHTHHTETGDALYVETKSYPFRDASGHVSSVIETLCDVTEKKLLEEQLWHAQKMEAIGTLAGGIAHDFNNILAAIIGYASLFEMKMSPEDPFRHNIEAILASANRAAHLTEGLLAFSRRQTVSMRPVELNAIVRNVKNLLVHIIGEDITLEFRLYEGALGLLADSGQIEQVLMNLATNARDAMPSGGSLHIATTAIGLDGRFIKAHGYGRVGIYAMISATDTGCGMDEKTVKRIFEPFFTTKEVGKGTGLGLAMVYGIVKQHNGYVNVYSEPGKGTTFNIYLPLTKASAREPEGQQPVPLVGGSETILVAEDDESLRKLIASILKEFGYCVIEARDGAEAVRSYQENQQSVRLVIMDVIMPRMNGKDAGEAIWKIQPQAKILFQSGYPADSVEQRGLIDGENFFLHKPVSPQVLLKKVREILDS